MAGHLKSSSYQNNAYKISSINYNTILYMYNVNLLRDTMKVMVK